MATFNLGNGGITTFEVHETSNTPPGVPAPESNPIGSLPEYGTAVPNQGGDLVAQAKTAIRFLEGLPSEIISVVKADLEAAAAAPEPAAEEVVPDVVEIPATSESAQVETESVPAAEAAPEPEAAAPEPAADPAPAAA